jgi:hypothetical protein
MIQMMMQRLRLEGETENSGVSSNATSLYSTADPEALPKGATTLSL